MKLVDNGSDVVLINNPGNIIDELPVDQYELMFDPNSGFSLSRIPRVRPIEFKVYGPVEERVKRIYRRYDYQNQSSMHNTGVLLSGLKGTGKTILLRKVTLEAYERGLPVINVNNYAPGIDTFFGGITQPVLVIFDEFEKTFGDNRQQERLLSMIDGTGSKNGHLFIFAANNLQSVTNYMLSRPGRVHYHFRYQALSDEVIEQYIKDYIKDPERLKVARTVLKPVEVTFDILQAVVWEVNQGYSKEEIIEGLNIDTTIKFRLVFVFKDGSEIVSDVADLNYNNRYPLIIGVPPCDKGGLNQHWKFPVSGKSVQLIEMSEGTITPSDVETWLTIVTDIEEGFTSRGRRNSNPFSSMSENKVDDNHPDPMEFLDGLTEIKVVYDNGPTATLRCTYGLHG